MRGKHRIFREGETQDPLPDTRRWPPPREACGVCVVPGDTQGPLGDAPVNPTCNEHSRNHPWKRKVASDTNQQEPTHPSAGLKAQDLRVDLHPPQTSAGVFRSHDTAAMTWHLHPLLQQPWAHKTTSLLLQQ